MASKGQFTGMRGVYLAAAELTKRKLVTAIITRNAADADLLVTNTSLKKAWSVQVKTNTNSRNRWLVNKNTKSHISNSFVYIFVHLGSDTPEYVVASSKRVAESVELSGKWPVIRRNTMKAEGWEIFDT